MENQIVYEAPQPTRIEILAAQTVQYYELLIKYGIPAEAAANIAAAVVWGSLK